MAIAWDASMTTALPDIDEQHQRLIQVTNDLMEALAQGKARQEIGRILDFLNDYAAEHFAKEEAYMAKYKCPAALANKLAHSNFVKTFGELHERFHKEGRAPRWPSKFGVIWPIGWSPIFAAWTPSWLRMCRSKPEGRNAPGLFAGLATWQMPGCWQTGAAINFNPFSDTRRKVCPNVSSW